MNNNLDINKDFEEIIEILSPLTKIERSYKHKRTFFDKKNNKRFFNFKWYAIPVIGFLLFMVTVSVAKAQNSLPGDSLFPLKKFSESVYSKVNPSFKGEIIIRRSQEIKKLTEKNEDAKKVEKAVDEYRRQKKDSEHDEKAIKQSQENLEEAKEKATPLNKLEIEKVIEKKNDEDEDKNDKVKGAETKFEKSENRENKKSERD